MADELPNLLDVALREVALAAGLVANYCDRAEHLEQLDRAWISQAGATLRGQAMALGAATGLDVWRAYARRLGSIEDRHVLRASVPFDGEAEAAAATTWSELQTVQAEHDRWYHPDVTGLARSDQLRHYAFHLSKLAGAIAEVTGDHERWPDFAERRLPDLLLFGIKLATVTGERLPDEPAH